MSFDPCSQRMMDSGEEIVISGIAGRFPESDNMQHFQENLFNKVDLVTDDDRRWKLGEQKLILIIIYSSLFNYLNFYRSP